MFGQKVIFLGVGAAALALAQYGGPTVLSRGASLMDTQKGMPVGFQYYASVNGISDRGLLPVSVDSNGNLANISNLFGVEAGFGVSGLRNWSHASLALHYDGSYRHYTEQTYFDGSDHTLGLDGRYDLSRRWSIRSRNSAGSVSRTLNGFGGYVTAPDGLVGVPSYDIFDNRTYFIQTSEDMIYQASARLSIALGGQGFAVRRQSGSLFGVDGYGAHSSVAYRVSRRSSIDVAYNFSHFDYPKAFGEADLHNITTGWSTRWTRRWQLSLLFGGYLVHTIGTQVIQLDPATAALFGRTSSYRGFDTTKFLPSIGGSLNGGYKKFTLTAGYSRGANPGNGVYLASTAESFDGSIVFRGTSRLSVSINGAYQRLKSIGQSQLGNYQAGSGGGGLNYRFAKDLHLTARGEFRKTGIDNQNGLNRLGSRVTVGLAYSPGERPLNLFR